MRSASASARQDVDDSINTTAAGRVTDGHNHSGRPAHGSATARKELLRRETRSRPSSNDVRPKEALNRSETALRCAERLRQAAREKSPPLFGGETWHGSCVIGARFTPIKIRVGYEQQADPGDRAGERQAPVRHVWTGPSRQSGPGVPLAGRSACFFDAAERLGSFRRKGARTSCVLRPFQTFTAR